MRHAALLLCLGLAACAGANAKQEFNTAPDTTGSVHAPALAARAAQASAKGDTEWWKEGGITREKINAMCWMKYEQGRRDVQIDKRADLVNACVVQTLKENPIR
jgi:hypothetical protein